MIFLSCATQEEKEEKLAKQYCGTCHVFPPPELLPRQTWQQSVLPQMAFRMGFADVAIQSRLPRADMNAVLAAIPEYPILTPEEFESISNYYLRYAPDSLSVSSAPHESLQGFNLIDVPAVQGELITALTYDDVNAELFTGSRAGRLFKLNHNLVAVDSVEIGSPVSDIKVFADEILVSAMGIMDPTEQARGKIASLDLSLNMKGAIVDSLQRPVYFEKGDLNGDNREDFLVCNFGHYTGNLLILEALQNGQYQKHYLNRLPGARKVVIDDFDNDGLNDILVLMTQGDERITLYYNEGGFRFREETIMRFPPVYGSSYLEVVDFNHDGFPDILTTNGDNADYSVVHKPYHAVRLFLNDKKNYFREVWSYSMPGASQCKAHDFDNDGDVDIAAISFFAKQADNTGSGFLLFENVGDFKFKSRSLRGDRLGRWLVMETGDFDNDSDIDIFLGAFNHNGLGAKELKMAEYAANEDFSLLILQNTGSGSRNSNGGSEHKTVGD